MKEEQSIGVKEIARKAGVSIATVDRVLHNRAGVSEATKKTINDIIKKYNYQPNILARRLASRKILKLATLIPAVSKETDYWLAPLAGIEQAEMQVKHYGISIDKYFFDLDDKKTFAAQVRKIFKSQVDGVLLAPYFVEEAKLFAAECDKRNIPYVFINSNVAGQNNLSYVGPDLYASGYTGGHLVDYIIKENEKALVVNILRVPDSFYQVEKEDGFRAYFEKEGKKINIDRLDIRKTDYTSIKKELDKVLDDNISVIFVTNSRVFYVAQYLEQKKLTGISLVGYDFINKNLHYLEKRIIDFLICQKPQEQAYTGIISLYNKLVKGEIPDKNLYMSIDIITKENFRFYKN